MDNQISILYIGVSPSLIEKFSGLEEIMFTVHSNLLAAENYLKNNQKPDAILCDLYLSGGGDGIEFHKRLRSDEKFNEVAFILLSDEFKKDIYDKAFVNNIDDYYVLPDPTIEALLNRVKFLKKYRHKYPFEPPKFVQDVKFKMPVSKRAFDLVVAISALVLLSPILLVVIAAIWIESKGKGKVYYTSKRFGSSEIFDFYKLRSMRIGSDKEIDKLKKEKNQYTGGKKQEDINYSIPCKECERLGTNCSTVLEHDNGKKICETEFNRQMKALGKSAFVKVSNDPRVTRVGKFIRKTSIDELPQLINVIKGDMSIVGNRPLPIYEVEFLLKDRNTRALAPAGITGLWQVKLRGRRGVMSNFERMSFDDEYTDHFEEFKHLNSEYAEHFSGGKWSFWYDFKLILQTVMVLFQKDSV
jgi:lipopolysaccharide/colanic/teichoic acid biosynthesis glycosyltransferase